MDPSLPTQRPRSREFDISSLESSSQTFSVEGSRRHHEISPSIPVGQNSPQSHENPQQQYATEHLSNQSEPNAEAFLLNENGSTKDAANNVSSSDRWKALGSFAICILVLGTIGMIIGMALLTYLWRSSMRAQAGHVDNGSLWNLIIRTNSTSVTVTVTAAVIRVCLGSQMGILTGMVASLLIERTGVPMTSAPLISMLRAVSASPYHLVSKTTLKTPFAIAICLAVVLTGVSQFTSTALLVDFENIHIITPKQTVESFYGKTKPDDAGGTSRGFKIWNSQPGTYFRFAEQRNSSITAVVVDKVDDSGMALRAILPFTKVADRINLRGYEGTSVVFDLRVLCSRPDITVLNFSTVAQAAGSQATVIASGNFSIPPEDVDPDFERDYYSQRPLKREFQCVISGPKGSEKDAYWGISICSFIPDGGESLAHLPSPLPTWNRTSIFLVFNTTGPYYNYENYVGDGENNDDADEMWRSLEKLNSKWTTSEHGIWSRWQTPPGSIGATVSVSACFTNMPGFYQNVSMSSNHAGFEPSLLWDRGSRRYEIGSIRDRYINFGDNTTARDLQGIMDLHPKTHWGFENEGFHFQQMISETAFRYWMNFDSVDDDMPFVDFGSNTEIYRIRRCALLIPGAFSPCAVHFAHAEVFQAIAKKTGSVAQGLQGLFTILREMAYYDESRYFDRESTASISLSSEKLIPTAWVGFSFVVMTIVVHSILLIFTTILFLGWTKASWLGNVWASLSQVVSSETEGFIDKSTDKDDKAVEKMILAERSGADEKLTYRVRVKANESNGRNELSLI